MRGGFCEVFASRISVPWGVVSVRSGVSEALSPLVRRWEVEYGLRVMVGS